MTAQKGAGPRVDARGPANEQDYDVRRQPAAALHIVAPDDQRATAAGEEPASWALRYAALGWHVFPCRPDKTPYTEHGFKDATSDRIQIEQWWRQYPDAQIGWRPGPSGHLVVDLDVPKNGGGDGRDFFKALRGSDPRGTDLLASTPSGGQHLVYRMPANRRYGMANLKKLGIDVRGFGGYVILPDGRPEREWVNEGPEEQEAGTVAAWLQLWLDQTVGPAHEPGAPRAYGDRVSPAGTASDVKLAEVRSALFAIEATVERTVWLNLIFAAYDALQRDERGAALVEEWSAQAEPYDEASDRGQYREGEAYRIYASGTLAAEKLLAKRREPVTAATLFHLAKENGWKWEPGDKADAELRAVIANHSVSHPPAAQLPAAQAAPARGESAFPHHLIEGDDLISRSTRAICDSAPIRQPALTLGAVLAALGALLGRRVQVEGTKLRTNLYVVGVGGTSSGKNHPLSAVSHHLAKTDPALVGPREFMSDSAIVATLMSTPCFASFIDEFGLYLRGSTDKNAMPWTRNIVTTLLQLFSSAARTMAPRAYADQVKNKPVPIHEPCLSLCGLTTPSTLIDALSSKNVADGLLGRCLLFVADDAARKRRGMFHPGQDHTSDDVVTQWWGELMQGLRRPGELPDSNTPAGERCRSLAFSPDAADYLDEEVLAIEEERKDQSTFGAVWARLVENTAKVALIRAAATDVAASTIEIAHVQWAHQLVSWCLSNLERLLASHLSDNDVEAKTKRLLHLVERAGAAGISASDLTRATQWLNRGERKDIIATLLEADQLTVEEVPAARSDGKGKPKTVYRREARGS